MIKIGLCALFFLVFIIILYLLLYYYLSLKKLDVTFLWPFLSRSRSGHENTRGMGSYHNNEVYTCNYITFQHKMIMPKEKYSETIILLPRNNNHYTCNLATVPTTFVTQQQHWIHTALISLSLWKNHFSRYESLTYLYNHFLRFHEDFVRYSEMSVKNSGLRYSEMFGRYSNRYFC